MEQLREMFAGLSHALRNLCSERLTESGAILYDSIASYMGKDMVVQMSNAALNAAAKDFANKWWNSTYKENDKLHAEVRALKEENKVLHENFDKLDKKRSEEEKENAGLHEQLCSLEEDYAKARARERLYNTERAILEEELFAAKSGANRYRKLAVDGINIPLRVVISPGTQNFLNQGWKAQEMSLRDRVALHGALYGNTPCTNKGCEGNCVHPPQEHAQTTPFKVGDMKTSVPADMTAFQSHMNRAIDKLERTIKTNRPNMAPDKFTASTKTLDRLRGMFQ